MRICGVSLVLVYYTGETRIVVWGVGRMRRVWAEYEYVGYKRKMNDNVEKWEIMDVIR
jgi:hypothetical protein